MFDSKKVLCVVEYWCRCFNPMLCPIDREVMLLFIKQWIQTQFFFLVN